MDGQRFDAMTRTFQVVATRRRTLATLIGLAAGASVVADADAANRTCRHATHKCVKDSQCCTGYCERRSSVRRTLRNRCTCPANETLCAGACCPAGEQCVEGLCCAPGDIVCDGACCSGDCLDGICCPSGTTVTCDGQCCAEDEICRDGGCGLPCATLIPNAFVCSYSAEGVEYSRCPGVSEPQGGPCTSSAECVSQIYNSYRYDCGAPGNTCFCQTFVRAASGYSDVTEGGACTFGIWQIGGTCP